MSGYLGEGQMRFKKADYENWLRRPIWTLEEGIQLLFGIEPIHNVVGSLRRIQEPERFKQEIITRLDIGGRSIRAGTLKVDGNHYASEWACELYPSTFLKWAESNGWEIPDELAGILNSPEPEQPESVEQSPMVDRPLDTRERRTLLIIIEALAQIAKVATDSPYAAAKAIALQTQQLGAAVGEKTIADKLKEIPEALENRK